MVDLNSEQLLIKWPRVVGEKRRRFIAILPSVSVQLTSMKYRNSR